MRLGTSACVRLCLHAPACAGVGRRAAAWARMPPASARCACAVARRCAPPAHLRLPLAVWARRLAQAQQADEQVLGGWAEGWECGGMRFGGDADGTWEVGASTRVLGAGWGNRELGGSSRQCGHNPDAGSHSLDACTARPAARGARPRGRRAGGEIKSCPRGAPSPAAGPRTKGTSPSRRWPSSRAAPAPPGLASPGGRWEGWKGCGHLVRPAADGARRWGQPAGRPQ